VGRLGAGLPRPATSAHRRPLARLTTGTAHGRQHQPLAAPDVSPPNRPPRPHTPGKPAADEPPPTPGGWVGRPPKDRATHTVPRSLARVAPSLPSRKSAVGVGVANRSSLRFVARLARCPDSAVAVASQPRRPAFSARSDRRCFAPFVSWRGKIELVAESDAVRSRRKRLHAAGDHSMCVVGRCLAATEQAIPNPAMDDITAGLGQTARAAVEMIACLRYQPGDPRWLISVLTIRAGQSVRPGADPGHRVGDPPQHCVAAAGREPARRRPG
jgi:hypothetical protein